MPTAAAKNVQGRADAPDLTVDVPDEVWSASSAATSTRQALMEQRYRVERDYLLLAKLREWFPSRGA